MSSLCAPLDKKGKDLSDVQEDTFLRDELLAAGLVLRSPASSEANLDTFIDLCDADQHRLGQGVLALFNHVPRSPQQVIKLLQTLQALLRGLYLIDEAQLY